MCNLSEALVENTIKDTIKVMLSKGKTPKEIEDITDYPLELIEEVLADMEEE